MLRAMTRSLNPKCPDFGRKATIAQMRHCHEYCLVFTTIFYMLFPITEVENAGIAKWKLWRARLEK